MIQQPPSRLATQRLQELLLDQSGANTAELTLAIHAGASVHGLDDGGLPLRLAIEAVDVDAVQLLIGHGANTNAPLSSSGSTATSQAGDDDVPLHLAARIALDQPGEVQRQKALGLVLELVASGADLHHRDPDGRRAADLVGHHSGHALLREALTHPLHAAIELHDAKLCMRLLERGFDPTHRDEHGRSAWRRAELVDPKCLSAMLAIQAAYLVDEWPTADVGHSRRP